MVAGLFAACGEGLGPVEGEVELPAEAVEVGDVGDVQPEESQAELMGHQLLRPDGTVQSGWRVIGGGSAWEKLDEAVNQPMLLPAESDHLWAGAAGAVTEVSVANPSSYRGDPGEAIAWFYGNTEKLRRMGYASEAQEIARSLFPATYDTARSDAQVQAVRTRLARRLASILGGPTP